MNSYKTDWQFPHEAEYNDQVIPRFQGNDLIGAMPTMNSDEALREALTLTPNFAPEQRDWDTYLRMLQVAGLCDFMVPMSRNLMLARSIEMLIRQGYVGRGPATRQHITTLSRLHLARKDSGAAFAAWGAPSSANLTTALLGLSGMGKSTTLKLIRRLYPPVIYHERHDAWQIPILQCDFPHDGFTVKGVMTQLLKAVDSLIPGTDYYETYGTSDRMSVPKLLANIAAILHVHGLGVLLVDEVQSALKASPKKDSLLALFLWMSNILNLPVVFVGTNAASPLLQNAMAHGRRSTGFGMRYWGQYEYKTTEKSEWEQFFTTLFPLQWLRKPIPHSPNMSKLFYDLSQGIPDIAIKLFAAAQWRALLDGSEQLTGPLLADVASNELAPVQPMLAALAAGDDESLSKFDDLAPVSFSSLTQQALARFEGPQVTAAGVRAQDASFVPTLADSLGRLGTDAQLAERLAERVVQEHPSANLLQGAEHALGMLKPTKRVKVPGDPTSAVPPRSDLPPEDMRNAVHTASEAKTTIQAQLQAMKIVRDPMPLLGLA